MTFTFDPQHMDEDLRALSRGASDFLAPQSPERVDRLASSLRNAVANSKKSATVEFVWRTEPGASIRVRSSRCWKGGTNNFDPLDAEVQLEYACIYLADAGRVKAKGVAVVSIRDVAGGKEKIVHFDVDEGGWSEIVDGQPAERAGHPPFHAQFYGMVNDIPRIPSLIVHPVDVINFAILELHQRNWRQFAETSSARAKLRHLPPRQRKRLEVILERWAQVVRNPDFHALTAMQRPFVEPLSL